MKRKAILIGNTSGLPGVKVDLQRFQNFLLSNVGGAWITDEIEVLTDVSRTTLEAKLTLSKFLGLDYVIVLFSGHGGQRKETVLEINKNGEQIEESRLRDIAQRQLTIYDCCRCYEQPVLKAESRALNQYVAFMESASDVRRRYEFRIMQAIPQQARLYSCAVGQISYDSPDGGIYLTNLMKSAAKFDNEFKLVGVAHEEAQGPTILHSLNKTDGLQTPESILPKCLSSQQLVLSLRA